MQSEEEISVNFSFHSSNVKDMAALAEVKIEGQKVTGRPAAIEFFTKILKVFPREGFVELTIPLKFGVEEFSKSCLKICPYLHSEAFVSPTKLHLTICMLRLPSKRQIAQIVPLLSQMRKSKIKVVIKGVAIMKGTIQKCHVLYAKVEENDRLDELGKQILCSLASFGLIYDFRPIKWHATLINTKYCPEMCNGFDATKILEAYSNFDFGESILSSIHLSNLEMPLNSKSGYYHSDHIWELR